MALSEAIPINGAGSLAPALPLPAGPTGDRAQAALLDKWPGKR
jgi:hypothetical protein